MRCWHVGYSLNHIPSKCIDRDFGCVGVRDSQHACSSYLLETLRIFGLLYFFVIVAPTRMCTNREMCKQASTYLVF